MANQDKKEIERKLSKDEEKRLEEFEKLSIEMEEKGYQMRPLTVSIVKANLFAIALAVPVFIGGIILFFLLHKDGDIDFGIFSNPILFTAAVLLLTLVHELIHGSTWACFTKNHFRDIAFGFMKQYLTPYCSCKVPLHKSAYITGSLMPLILLGIVPAVIAEIIGSFPLLIISLVMITEAAGDILIVINTLKYRSDAEDILYLDHPTQAGGVIFER